MSGSLERPEWIPARPYDFCTVHGRLLEIVASKPEGYAYVKPKKIVSGSSVDTCSYWHLPEPDVADDSDGLGGPGCIVGQLLYSFGVPREVLLGCDGNGKGSTSWSSVAVNFPAMFTTEVSCMLQYIQSEQDDGKLWSELAGAVLVWRRGWLDALAETHKAMRRFTSV